MVAELEQEKPILSSQKKSGLWSWIRFILVVGVIWIVMNNSVGLMKVSGNSMNPTLQSGAVLVINKLSLLFGLPEYGDVVILSEEALGYSIVKRVIAVEGDRVSITDGLTYVNGVPLVELYSYGQSEDMAEATVGINELFVVGDNRSLGESLDSRDPQVGMVHVSDISGYAVFSLWPMHGIAKPLELHK